MNNNELAEKIFLAGIRSVLPGRLIENIFSLKGSVLRIGHLSYDLASIKNVYILGAGKASAAMAHYVEYILDDRIKDGFIVTKYGFYCKLRYIRVVEAGHPEPDVNSFRASDEILHIADMADENDLVICLWSGGGSSLLADYPVVSSPEDVICMYKLLVKSGADIREMNTVRKHLSGVKGGFLAKHICPAPFVSILLSDVIGDHPDIIASGPAVPDDTTFADALRVLEDYNLISEAPERLVNYIVEGKEGKWPETPETGNPVFNNSAVLLAGSNRTALQAARSEAEEKGLTTFIITSELCGEVSDACSSIMDTILEYLKNDNIKKPLCLLFGGETTVKVTGKGSGGRNQHLALSAAMKLKDIPGVTMLAAGTDGNDGLTDMAGAVIDSDTVKNALAININPESYFFDFDSYNFFKLTGGHIHTGPTMTNVMDMIVVIIS
jgi:glycerate-2-kinase